MTNNFVIQMIDALVSERRREPAKYIRPKAPAHDALTRRRAAILRDRTSSRSARSSYALGEPRRKVATGQRYRDLTWHGRASCAEIGQDPMFVTA